MKTKTVALISCSLELATGVAVIASPDLVARVLFSTELTPGGEAIGRVGGCGLLCLAIACWPRSACWVRNESDYEQPIRALFFYNLLAAIYLGYLEFGGDFASPFLLPAGALHALLAFLLARPVYKGVTAKAPTSSS